MSNLNLASFFLSLSYLKNRFINFWYSIRENTPVNNYNILQNCKKVIVFTKILIKFNKPVTISLSSFQSNYNIFDILRYSFLKLKISFLQKHLDFLN